MASSAHSDSEYFSGNNTTKFFSPTFKIKIPVANHPHDIIREMRFPWNIKDLVSKYPYARIKQVNILYTPFIWVTDHGKVIIQVKDRRKAQVREQNLCILETSTNIQTQFEISNIESCSRHQRNPISFSISLDTRGLTPHAIVGQVDIFATFSYSREMYGRVVPTVSIARVSGEGAEKTFTRNRGDAMLAVSVVHGIKVKDNEQE